MMSSSRLWRPESVVRELYAKIYRDTRHEHVDVLASAEVSGRVFGRWAMAKVAGDCEPDIPLLTNLPGIGRSATVFANGIANETRRDRGDVPRRRQRALGPGPGQRDA